MQHVYSIALVATAVSSSPLHSLPDNTPSTHSSLEPLSFPQASHGTFHQCHFTSPNAQPISSSLLPSPNFNIPQALLQLPSPPSTKPSGIPPSAWPHISTLLIDFIMERQNGIRTLNLGRMSDDAELEGVMVGLVYTSTSHSKPERSPSKGGRVKIKRREKKVVPVPEEMGGGDEKKVDRWLLACVQSAVGEVERTRLMEGVLEIPGGAEGDFGGRASFLVYRVD
ncbi:hypothetical protein HYALB_00007512 [Hymenoscyphus albidus]|uniref:Uncharacterized protein n=1 Tax=Hymenoscyphus albidus TaxID=595503 RepID=A0A9N9M0F1_9HELO|nr:hypothetical protein HYALB_00007512 [Hymenoscyphus albidus]